MQLKIIVQLHLIHESSNIICLFHHQGSSHGISRSIYIRHGCVSVGVPVEISQWIGPAIGMLIWHLVLAQRIATNAVTSQVINSTISSPSTT
jgi:hypothetical protein